MSETSIFSFFKLVGDNILDKNINEFLDTSIKSLIDSPVILRETIGLERIYYAGNDDAYKFSLNRGKITKWLHNFFEDIRSVLVERGMKPRFGANKTNINFLDYTAREAILICKACKILNANIEI